MIQVTNSHDLQPAIDWQQVHGGALGLGAGIFDGHNLTPFPSVGGATQPLVIRGQGMYATTLRLDAANQMLFAYWKGQDCPSVAQLIISDLTLDGGYGRFPQPTQGAVGMIAAYTPYSSARTPVAPTGQYHHFERVRFYRPQAYVFQPSESVKCINCIFEECGQPDQPLAATHYDNLGSGGFCDAWVTNSSWVNSSGNYADFVAGTPGQPSRITFTGNVSRRHQLGGIYAAGRGSLIAGNDLENLNPGSGVGYDSQTNAANRGGNVVTGNRLVNLSIDKSGLSAALNDLVSNNGVAVA